MDCLCFFILIEKSKNTAVPLELHCIFDFSNPQKFFLKSRDLLFFGQRMCSRSRSESKLPLLGSDAHRFNCRKARKANCLCNKLSDIVYARMIKRQVPNLGARTKQHLQDQTRAPSPSNIYTVICK